MEVGALVVFTALYAVATVLVFRAVKNGLLKARDVGITAPAGGLADCPQDAAYLKGGARLAVFAALTALHRREAVGPAGRGTVVRLPGLAVPADELERAVWQAVDRPVRWRRAWHFIEVREALDRTDARLVAAGLLMPPRRRRRISVWTAALLVPFGAVGVGWIVAETVVVGFDDAVDSFRVFPMVVIALVALMGLLMGIGSLFVRETASLAGQAELRRLWREHPELNPHLHPELETTGPDTAALAVAVFGVEALWAMDSEFATAIRAPRPPGRGSGG